MVLCGVAASGPAHGSAAHSAYSSAYSSGLVSTAAPPAGVRSLAYYEGTTVDARAELREIRAALRDAVRARADLDSTSADVVGAPPGVVEAGTVQAGDGSVRSRAGTRSATAAGAGAASRSSRRARLAQRVAGAGHAPPWQGPGRQPAARRADTRFVVRQTVAVPAWTGEGGVVGFALAQVGKAYEFGSVGPQRFDCSGLVSAAYRQAGITLPHQTGALARVGRPVSRGELRPGDLVFPAAGHVGIYVGGGRMVHASTERGGVKLSPIYAFSFARRIG